MHCLVYVTGSQKIDHLQKKMKIHFLASVSPKFIRKYDEPLSVFLRRFSAKIQTKTLHAFSPINRSFVREKSLYSETPEVRKFLRVTVTPTFAGEKMAVCLLKPRSLEISSLLAFLFTNWICCSASCQHPEGL